MVIDGGGFFNVLVSKNNRNYYIVGMFTFNRLSEYLLAWKQGKRSTDASLFASFSYQFICFFASSCLQMSLLTILLEGVLSYNPPVRKSVSRGKTAGDSKGRPGEMQAGRGGAVENIRWGHNDQRPRFKHHPPYTSVLNAEPIR